MKKLLIAAAALSVVAGAQAQSSVTLSGQVQAGAYNAIDPALKTTLGQLAGSRTFITFAATEDMGGGLKAGYMAQIRLNPSTGIASYTNGVNTTATNSYFEQTKAFISTNYGQVNAGKYTTMLGAAQGWVSPMGDDGALSARAATQVPRMNGTVAYVSPAWNGLQVEILKAYNDQQATVTTGATAQDYKQNTITYATGPVQAFYGHTTTNADVKNQQYGVAYNFGVVKVMASQNKNSGGLVADSQYTGVDNDTLTSFAAQVPFGLWNFGIAAVESDKTDYKRTSVSAEYNLSKRTKLMAQWAKAEKDTTATKNGTGTYFGMSHAF
jgi:predicted porin